MNIVDNVKLPLMIRNMSGSERRKTAVSLLTSVGLGDKLSRKPTELSGGEQQRVAVARALAGNPSIILGDEITGNLDSRNTFQIVNLLRDLNQRFGNHVHHRYTQLGGCECHRQNYQLQRRSGRA